MCGVLILVAPLEPRSRRDGAPRAGESGHDCSPALGARVERIKALRVVRRAERPRRRGDSPLVSKRANGDRRSGVVEYAGHRDPRFVRRHRGGLLDEAQHRLLARWAAQCAEHVVPLSAAAHEQDERPMRAIAIAHAWARGEATVSEARAAASAAHAAARDASDAVARDVARAAGHAAATAHMADHGLGAAMYAIKAVQRAAPPEEATVAGERECRWQRQQLPDAIRDLVLSDEDLRNERLGRVFIC